MKRLKKKKVSGSTRFSRLEKMVAEEELNTEDYYRVLIWNSILDMKSKENLRYLVNAAMTFSHKEKAGCNDPAGKDNIFEYITSGEVTKQFLSKE